MFNDNFSFTSRDLNVDRLNGGLHSPINDTTSEFGQLSPLTRLHSTTSMRSSKSKSSKASSTVSRAFVSSFWRNSRSVLVSPTETECTTNRFSVQDREFPLPMMTLTVPEAESFVADDGSTNGDMYDQLPGIVSAMEANPARRQRPGSRNNTEEILLGSSKGSINGSASSSSTSTTRSQKNRLPPLTIPTSTQGQLLGPQQATRKSHKPPPKLKSPVRTPHRRQHSEIADTIGVQLLLNAFDESEDDSSDPTPVRSNTPVRSRTPEPVVQAVQFTEPMSTNRRLSSLRPPTIDELDETNASETSSISTYYPASLSTSPDYRRYSHTSTIPTSISGQSIVEPSIPPPSLKTKDSFLFDSDRSDSDTCPEPRPLGRLSLSRSNSRRHPTTSDTESGSRRSSTNTFFCQGRNSIATSSINRNPSIASSYAFDDTYDETYYSELKAKIARLALKSRQLYPDSDEDEYAYDAPFRRSLGRTSRKNSTSCVQPKDVGAQWKPPVQRRTRRRTASSECVVLDVLESMETAAFELDNEWNDVGWDTDLVMEREESETEDLVRELSLGGYF